MGDPGSGLGGNWRVIVRNDDHNTFDDVARTLSRFIPGISLGKGYAIADTIHNTGQAIVCLPLRRAASTTLLIISSDSPTPTPSRSMAGSAAYRSRFAPRCEGSSST